MRYPMKIPSMPPNLHEYVATLPEDQRNSYLIYIFTSETKPVDIKRRYVHWDKLQYLLLPKGLASSLEYWHKIKAARSVARKATVFKDNNGESFTYVGFDRVMLTQKQQPAKGSSVYKRNFS